MLKNTPALVDSTGVGDPIVEDLQATCGACEGYHFTSQSKQRLMEGLAHAIHNGRIWFPSGPIVDELETFKPGISRPFPPPLPRMSAPSPPAWPAAW